MNLIGAFSNKLNKYSVKQLFSHLQPQICKSRKKKSNQVRRIFETKKQKQKFSSDHVTWESEYMFSYRWEVLKEAKQNYVTYIKSILYCNHACYYNNKWWIDKKEKEKCCQVSSNQIHDNWIPFIILEKNISLTVK